MIRYILILFIVISFQSCKKEETLKCTSNCKTYNIKGRVFDASNNTGFRNMPIILKWEYFRSNCIFCPKPLEDIFHGQTEINGNFSFSISIDSTLFNDYSLKIILPEKENYFKDWIGHFAFLNDTNNFNIAYYPLTNLSLKLNRTQADLVQSIRVVHSWTPIYASWQSAFTEVYEGPIPNRNGDTTIYTKTVAGTVTTATVWKNYSNATPIGIKDSIFCNPGNTNVININY